MARLEELQDLEGNQRQRVFTQRPTLLSQQRSKTGRGARRCCVGMREKAAAPPPQLWHLAECPYWHTMLAAPEPTQATCPAAKGSAASSPACPCLTSTYFFRSPPRHSSMTSCTLRSSSKQSYSRTAPGQPCTRSSMSVSLRIFLSVSALLSLPRICARGVASVSRKVERHRGSTHLRQLAPCSDQRKSLTKGLEQNWRTLDMNLTATCWPLQRSHASRKRASSDSCGDKDGRFFQMDLQAKQAYLALYVPIRTCGRAEGRKRETMHVRIRRGDAEAAQHVHGCQSTPVRRIRLQWACLC